MERSDVAVEFGTIPVMAVLVLLEVSGSGVAEVIVAVLLMLPDDANDDVFTEIVKLVSDSSSNAGAVQLTVPDAPTAGVVQVKSDGEMVLPTKVVPAGSASVTVTFCAVDGPALKTKTE